MNVTADLAEAEWDAVIKARVEEIDAGTAKLIPLEEVEAEMDVFVASLASSQPSRPVVVTHAQVVRQFKASARQRRKLGQVVPAEPYFVSPKATALFRQKNGSHCFLP
jgi:hypothetical protein